jgi:hypothetical protein
LLDADHNDINAGDDRYDAAHRNDGEVDEQLLGNNDYDPCRVDHDRDDFDHNDDSHLFPCHEYAGRYLDHGGWVGAVPAIQYR